MLGEKKILSTSTSSQSRIAWSLEWMSGGSEHEVKRTTRP